MKTTHLKVTLAFMLNLFLVLTSCSGSDDGGSDKEEPSTTINSLASLQKAFDDGNITHVDYTSNNSRDLLNLPITEMELFEQGSSVTDLSHVKITAKNTDGVSKVSRVTLEPDPFATTVNDVLISNWALTDVSLEGNEVSGFSPFTLMIESEINSGGLNLLDDRLKINFTKQ